MRKISSISKQSLQLFMGVVVSIFLLSQTSVSSQEVSNDTDPQEHTDAGSESQEEQVQIAEAVTSSGPQINLGFQSFLLQEVVLGEDVEEKKSAFEQGLPASQKALKVILRRIISPNAP